MTFGSNWFEGFDSQNEFFAYDMPLVSPLGNALVTKSFQTSELRERLFGRLRELMGDEFRPDYFRERIERLRGQIAGAMKRAPGADALVQQPALTQSAAKRSSPSPTSMMGVPVDISPPASIRSPTAPTRP